MGIGGLAREALRFGRKGRDANGKEAGSALDSAASEHGQPGPLVGIEIGSTYTRAALFDRVDGRYRFLAVGEAPTAFRGAEFGVLDAVREAVREVEQVTNRRISGPDGSIVPDEGSKRLGAAVATASGLLRVVVVGLTKTYSAESAKRAAAGANALVVAEVSLDSANAVGEARLQSLCQQVKRLQPEAIVIAGGTEKGASAPIVEFAQALAADSDPRLGESVIVFSGNSEAAASIKALLGGKYDLRCVSNLRPSLDEENLEPTREELRRIWRERAADRMPGLGAVCGRLSTPLTSCLEGFTHALRFIAAHERVRVIGFDLGGRTTSIIAVADEAAASYSLEPWGIGPGALELVLSGDSVGQWLGSSSSSARLQNAGLNKWARPWSVPETESEVLEEMSLARAALGCAFERSGFASLFARPSPERTLVIARGGAFAHCPNPLLAILAVVDSLHPTGVVEVGVDSASMLPQMGVLASLYPQAAAEVVLTDGVERLGTWIRPKGAASPGISIPIVVEANGGAEQRRSLAPGAIEVLPLGSNQRAHLTIGPCGALDFGAGRGRKARVSVRGGRLGAVVDARAWRVSGGADGGTDDDWASSCAPWLSRQRGVAAESQEGETN